MGYQFVTINLIGKHITDMKFAVSNIETVYKGFDYITGDKILVIKTNFDTYTFREGVDIKNVDIEFKKF
jgi:hypothetical protein